VIGLGCENREKFFQFLGEFWKFSAFYKKTSREKLLPWLSKGRSLGNLGDYFSQVSL
jgi:hypothetical protein